MRERTRLPEPGDVRQAEAEVCEQGRLANTQSKKTPDTNKPGSLETRLGSECLERRQGCEDKALT